MHFQSSAEVFRVYKMLWCKVAGLYFVDNNSDMFYLPERGRWNRSHLWIYMTRPQIHFYAFSARPPMNFSATNAIWGGPQGCVCSEWRLLSLESEMDDTRPSLSLLKCFSVCPTSPSQDEGHAMTSLSRLKTRGAFLPPLSIVSGSCDTVNSQREMI